MITNTLNLHLNVEQTMPINTSSIIISLKKISSNTLSNQTIDLNDKTQIFLPEDLYLNSTNNSTISFRVRFSKYIYLLLMYFILFILVCSNTTLSSWKFSRSNYESI